MSSLLIGAGVVVYLALFLFGKDQELLLLNTEALAIVGLGTLGILALSAPMSDILALLKACAKLLMPARSSRRVEMSLVALSLARNADVAKAHELIAFVQDLWSQGVEPAMIEALLLARLDELNKASESAVAVLRNLSKYPPALGMTGTVLGMIKLFSALKPEAKASIGPQLGLALIATLYGLVVANAVLMPLADRLQVKAISEIKTNEHVCQALLLINRDEPLSLLNAERGSHARAA